MALQEALDEEACLEEQILSLVHRFADRFTNRRPEINRLNSLPDDPLIEYGRYALGCMTGEDIKKAAYLKSAKKLGLPPPPALATFGMTAKDKKRKRTEILEEVFEKEDTVVNGMHRNLVPPLGIEGRQGLVIRNLSRGFFFYNGNWDLVFQREEEFYLATTTQLIRLQNFIQRNTP
ncbi:hypothetical protein Tco_1181624 [Tanacetum coccineum]